MQKIGKDGEKVQEEPTLLSRHSSWSSDSEQKIFNDDDKTKKVPESRPEMSLKPEMGVKPEVSQNRLAKLEVSSPSKKANEVQPLNRLKEELGKKLQQQLNNTTTSQQQLNNVTTSQQQLKNVSSETNTPQKLKFKAQTSPGPKIFKDAKTFIAKGSLDGDDREIEQPMSLPMPNESSHPDRYTTVFKTD